MDSVDQAGLRDSIFTGYRILVADDNPVNQRLAARMLENFGCRADIAGTGREAVRMHESRPYDLVLMDCRMPDLDGFQATAHIRAQEQPSRRTPIVALTASSTDDARLECAAAGMDDFLPKPLRQAPLREVLGRWLLSARSLMRESKTGRSGDELDAVQAVFGTDFGELAMLYRRDSSQRIRLLMDAADAGDARELARIGHLFCGSCASIGAMRLSALCKQLELSAKDGRLDEARRLLDAIWAEYARIEARLQSLAG